MKLVGHLKSVYGVQQRESHFLMLVALSHSHVFMSEVESLHFGIPRESVCHIFVVRPVYGSNQRVWRRGGKFQGEKEKKN